MHASIINMYLSINLQHPKDSWLFHIVLKLFMSFIALTAEVKEWK